MYELGGAKQAGSTYAYGGPAGKRGRSLREGRKNATPPLISTGSMCYFKSHENRQKSHFGPLRPHKFPLSTL